MRGPLNERATGNANGRRQFWHVCH